MEGDDRRRIPRAPIELRIEYRRLNSFFADYTKNISHGGTFISTDRALEVGTDFVFKLVIPHLPQPLSLRGKVQWTVEPTQATAAQTAGMGIAFVFDSPEERKRVESTVEKLMVESLGAALYQKLVGQRLR